MRLIQQDQGALRQSHYTVKLTDLRASAAELCCKVLIILDAFYQVGGKRIVARIDPKTQTRIEIANIPVDLALNPPWIHDLPGTENYILVPDTPTVMDFGLKVNITSVCSQRQAVNQAFTMTINSLLG